MHCYASAFSGSFPLSRLRKPVRTSMPMLEQNDYIGVPLNFWLCCLSRSLSAARSLASSASMAGLSVVQRRVSRVVSPSKHALTCGVCLQEFFENLFGLLEVTLLSKTFSLAEESFCVLLVLLQSLNHRNIASQWRDASESGGLHYRPCPLSQLHASNSCS